MTKAIRYFRPDVLFAITPWHLAEKCDACGGRSIIREQGHEPTPDHLRSFMCDDCHETGYRAACGYTPPEGWRAEVKERGPRCVECEEMVERENAESPLTHL